MCDPEELARSGCFFLSSRITIQLGFRVAPVDYLPDGCQPPYVNAGAPAGLPDERSQPGGAKATAELKRLYAILEDYFCGL